MGKKSKKKKNRIRPGEKPVSNNKHIYETREKQPVSGIKHSYKSYAGGLPVLSTLSLFFLAIIIIWGIFRQGFFFMNDSFLYHVMTCLFLIGWCGFYVYARRVPRVNYVPVLFLLVYAAFYGLSFFGAVNKAAAVEEFLKAANYLFVFVLALFVFRENSFFVFNKKMPDADKTITGNNGYPEMIPADSSRESSVLTLFLTVILTGLLLVLVGIFFKTDPSSVTYSFFLYDRFFSLLQYPNATASFLMISFLLTTSLIPFIRKKSYYCILVIIAAVTITGILLTFSRGIWVTLPFSCLLLLILSGKGQRLTMLVYMAAPAAASAAGFLITGFLQTDEYTGNILLTGIAAALSLPVFFAAGFFLNLKPRTRKTIAFAFSAAIVIALVSYTVLTVSGPVKLASGTDGLPEQDGISQAIHRTVEPGDYVFSFEVNTEKTPGYSAGSAEQERIWQVVINGYARDSHSTDINEFLLIKSYGSFSGSWTEENARFTVYKKLDRLEIEISSLTPGYTVAVKNANLAFPEKDMSISFLTDRLLPGSVYERFFSFRNIIAAEQRLVHSTDALKIAADYPMLGAGGGGWETLYLSYTDREYYTSEIHNHLLKIWTDAGIFALLGYLAFFIIFCWQYLVCRFGKKDDLPEKTVTPLYTAIFVVIVSVFAHSLIDFTLSYGLFNVLFFVLAAAGFSFNKEYNKKNKDGKFETWIYGALHSERYRFIVPGLFLLFAFFILLLNISHWNKTRAFTKAAEEFRTGEIEDARLTLERFNGSGGYYDPAYALKAEVMEALATESSGDMEAEYVFAGRALAYWEDAYRLAPFNPEYSRRLGLMKIQFGETREGLRFVEKITHMHPYRDEFYKQVASVRLDLAGHYMGPGEDYDYALELLEDNIALEEKMFKRNGETDALAFYMGRTYLMLGDRAAAQSYFSRVQPDDDYYHEARDMLYNVSH